MLNIESLKPALSRTLGRGMLITQKYSPEILTTVGVVGVVAAGVMAARATLQISPILEERKNDLEISKDLYNTQDSSEVVYSKSEHNQDVAKIYIRSALKLAKVYGPAVTLGAFSILSIVSAHGIMRRRNVALAAAYKTVESAFSEYRKRVAEEIGEDREMDIRRNRYEEIVKDEETDKEVAESFEHLGHSPYAKFFDEGSSQWRKNADYNLMFLKTVEQNCNDILHSRGHIFLNEVYDALDIPRTQAGQQVGWVRDNGDSFVDFGLYNIDDERKRAFVNGAERNILLDFNVDGPILHLI